MQVLGGAWEASASWNGLLSAPILSHGCEWVSSELLCSEPLRIMAE